MTDVTTTPKISFVVASEHEDERLYRVIIENDDVTPMDFVVFILTTIFALDINHAVDVMYEAHERGEALVTIMPYHTATAAVYRTHELARANGYPLRLYLELDAG